MEQVIITAVAGGLALAGTVYGYRSTRKNTELAIRVEANKAEAARGAEIIKVQTETEIKRTDQLLDTQMAFIRELQIENRAQRQEMLDKEKIHREEMLQVRAEVTEISRLMNSCIEARTAQEATIEKLRAEVLGFKGRLVDLGYDNGKQ